MDAIILVGGRGTRLMPLTARRHKSLLPVGTRRAFDYLLEWVGDSGFERAVLALGTHNEDLAAAYGHGSQGNLPLEIVVEPRPLNSGGAIRHAVGQAGVEGRFAVLNGDTFVEFPFAEMLRAHLEHRAELTLALHEEDDVRQFGVATVDGVGFVEEFVEKSPNPPSHLVNAGVWIFEPHLVGEIEGAVRVEDTLFPDLVRSGRRVYGHRIGGLWADIGTPARYLALVLALLERGLPGLAPDLDLGRGASVERSQIGPGCALGPGARVSGSILWENVQVGEEAVIEGSVVADGVVLGAGCQVRDAVIGPGAVLAAGVELPRGSTVDADRKLGGNDA